MIVWLLVFINCTQHEGVKGLYPVSCKVLNHKEPFSAEKSCMNEKRKFKGVDSSCVKVNVWRE